MLICLSQSPLNSATSPVENPIQRLQAACTQFCEDDLRSLARRSLTGAICTYSAAANEARARLLFAADCPSSPSLSAGERGSAPCSPSSPSLSLRLPRHKSSLTRLGRFPLLAPAAELASPPTFLGSPILRRRSATRTCGPDPSRVWNQIRVTSGQECGRGIGGEREGKLGTEEDAGRREGRTSMDG
jgi:hypothetical protein